MPMKNPPHPGHSIKDASLDPLGLSVTDGAKILGVARHTLSRVINGQAGISPEMAIRLEKAGWSNADHWLRMQAACPHVFAPAAKLRQTRDLSGLRKHPIVEEFRPHQERWARRAGLYLP